MITALPYSSWPPLPRPPHGEPPPAPPVSGSTAILRPVGRLSQMIPGLNLGVGVIEARNAIVSYRRQDHHMMTGHLGNSLACFSAFAEDAGRLASFYHKGHKVSGDLAGAVIGLGLVGGTLGVLQGVNEIRNGLSVKAHHGDSRTLHRGIADTLSGASTLVGIGLRMTGHAPTLAVAMLVGASLCDIASIAVDYWDERTAKL